MQDRRHSFCGFPPPNAAKERQCRIHRVGGDDGCWQSSREFQNVQGSWAQRGANRSGRAIPHDPTRSLTTETLAELDGHLVIAVDENGGRYFKRLRRRENLILLESLNPDGTAPAEVLSVGGEMAFPRLSALLEVVGVLFELPN